MIEICKTTKADTRSAAGPVSKEDLLYQSELHIDHVKKGFEFINQKMIETAEKHDWTKIEYIDQFHRDFSSGVTGKDFKKLPWFQIHMTKERHHWLDNCPSDITLIDVMEKCIDVTMAGLARSGSVYDEEIPNEILQKAYKNTIKMLIENTVVQEEINEEEMKSLLDNLFGVETHI